MKKNILILNTGGTISSIKTDSGYKPVAGYVTTILNSTPALSHADMPNYDIKEYDPLLDSSNVTISTWNQIATDISEAYQQYDGFILFHGTDTMAYTASALSFMLENLSKPVILTGSLIPLSEARNDAIENIITSLWLAAHTPIPEVCVYFNQHLFRGNRVQKTSSEAFNAFHSPNYPHLASVGTTIEIYETLVKKRAKTPFRLQTLQQQCIANATLFPGLPLSAITCLLQQPLKALILQTYGSGNAQTDPRFLEALTEACQKEVIIVNASQCPHGRVIMSQYATGFALKQAGLISAHDMTPEATYCKLLYLFSKYSNTAQIKRLLETNVSGELTNLR